MDYYTYIVKILLIITLVYVGMLGLWFFIRINLDTRIYIESLGEFEMEGNGKYFVIELEKLPQRPTSVAELCAVLEEYPEAINRGEVGSEDEFFVVKLKDVNAPAALMGYRASCQEFDCGPISLVESLISRAGQNSPYCKKPD